MTENSGTLPLSPVISFMIYSTVCAIRGTAPEPRNLLSRGRGRHSNAMAILEAVTTHRVHSWKLLLKITY